MSAASHNPRAATDVDAIIGARLRLRRQAAKISQEKLGDALGVTFQQVQKYERGTNRMSPGRLIDAAAVLGFPVAVFFEGLETGPAETDSEDAAELQAFIQSRRGVDLARACATLPDAHIAQLVNLARILSGLPAPEAGLGLEQLTIADFNDMAARQ